MTTTAPTTQSAPSGAGHWDEPADILVVFGITGDLARVMTFRSLYRLERRGLLDSPIHGVAAGLAPAVARRDRSGRMTTPHHDVERMP